MKRGDVVLVRFPHPSGQRGKKRPAVVVQSDAYASTVSTVVVAEVTKNLTMKGDRACLFIDVSTPEGKATGLLIDSVVSALVLDTVYTDTIAQVLGSLSTRLLQKLDDCLKLGLGLS
jgi:mRNA interferase MazF